MESAVKSAILKESFRRKNEAISPLDVTEDFAKWFTGFWEGDGTIQSWQKTINGYNVLRVYLAVIQKDLSALYYIKETVGYGSISVNGNNGAGHVAFESQKRCYPLIKIILKYVVSEHAIIRLDPVLDSLMLPQATAHELSMPWIAGFWEAEGSANAAMDEYGSLRLYFAQKERYVLERIQALVGGNLIWIEQSNVHHLVMYGNVARSLAGSMLPYIVGDYKRTQLSECLGMRDAIRQSKIVRDTSNLPERAKILRYMREHPEVVERLHSRV